MTTRDLTLIALFAVLTTACAQLSLTLPLVTNVPFTLQVFGVLMAGAILGARRGFLSQVLYLLLGFVGLPVFAGFAGGPAVLVGPTAGYLWSFPVAAWLVGLAADRTGRRERSYTVLATLYAGMLAGITAIYVCGVIGLTVTGAVPTLSMAVRVGIVPFLWFDLFKALAAGLVAVRLYGIVQ